MKALLQIVSLCGEGEALLASAVNDEYDAKFERAASAERALELVRTADRPLIFFAELREGADAVLTTLALKLFREAMAAGQVGFVVWSRISSPELMARLRQYGCSEIAGPEESEDSVRERALSFARVIAPQRKLPIPASGSFSGLGVSFLVSEWMAEPGLDRKRVAEMLCECVSEATGKPRVEFWIRAGDASWKNWVTDADRAPDFLEPGFSTVSNGVEWIGAEASDQASGAIVYRAEAAVTEEQKKLFRSAARAAYGLVPKV